VKGGKMKVLKSYKNGIREAIQQPKMIVILWIINFIFGSVIFFLIFGGLSKAAEKSLIAESLHKRFDYNFLFEFLAYYGETIRTIFSVAFFLIMIYFLISVFLYGGILFSLVHSQKISDAEKSKVQFAQIFFQGAGKFFGRFFRLTIYSLILWIIFIIFIFLLYRVGRVLTGNGTNEQLAFYLFLVEIGIGLFLLFLIKMILDYTRIKIVTEDSCHVFRSLFKVIKFVFQRSGRTLGLYYLLVLTGAVLFVIYWVLQLIIPSYSFFTILITFIMSQLFIASRGWLKMAFQASQLIFYLPERS
jgi:hypothetical protein